MKDDDFFKRNLTFKWKCVGVCLLNDCILPPNINYESIFMSVS